MSNRELGVLPGDLELELDRMTATADELVEKLGGAVDELSRAAGDLRRGVRDARSVLQCLARFCVRNHPADGAGQPARAVAGVAESGCGFADIAAVNRARCLTEVGRCLCCFRGGIGHFGGGLEGLARFLRLDAGVE